MILEITELFQMFPAGDAPNPHSLKSKLYHVPYPMAVPSVFLLSWHSQTSEFKCPFIHYVLVCEGTEEYI